MTTLVKHMIVAGADNRPPMLEKSMYDSCKVVMIALHTKDGVTRPKTYEKLLKKEKLQADCDLKATNIVLQGLPPDVYSLVNHHNVAKKKLGQIEFTHGKARNFTARTVSVS
ncbi:hypothetical protein Tco_0780460 [Tanacetum coccineum]